jgi:hypothetical protein
VDDDSEVEAEPDADSGREDDEVEAERGIE